MGMPSSLSRLPSLDLVRGFVAVGRRMSITLAAEDLHLTQSAVSRQIHALEEKLGVKLLVRGHRSIGFTPEGERLFLSADRAMEQIQTAIGEIRTVGALRPVMLSASVGFTGLWLLPRLSRLQSLHPTIDLRISANNRVSDLRNEGIDLAIRYTSQARAPDHAQRLFGESTAPVAHPALGLGEPLSAESLSRLTLLEFDDPGYPWLRWGDWLEARGWGGVKPRGFLRFNQYDLVIQAALAGQGLALGRLELIQPLIDEGRLRAFGPPRADADATRAYWLIQAEMQARREVQSVAQWIRDEAAGAEPTRRSRPTR